MFKTIVRAIKDAFRINRWQFLWFTILNVVTSLTALIPAYIVKLFIDTITAVLSKKIDIAIGERNVLIYAIFYGVYLVGASLIFQVYNYVYTNWRNDYLRKIRLEITNFVKDLPLGFFEKESVGRIQEKIGSGADAKLNILRSIFIDLLPEFATIIVVIPVLVRTDLTLTLLGISGIPFFIAFRWIMLKKAKDPLLKGKKHMEDYGAVQNELLHNIKVIKAFNRGDYEQDKLAKVSEGIFENQKEVVKIRSIYNFLSTIFSNLPDLFVTVLGAFWAIAGKITIGDIVLFRSYLYRIYGPLWRVSQNLNQLEEDVVAAGRLDEIFENKIEFEPSDLKTRLIAEDIKFRNVSYQYDQGGKVLNNLNLEIKKGTVVALVGPSGVGKSTIIKLLLRFIEPVRGKIYVGKDDLGALPKIALRNSMGLVFQDALLFNDTVTNNIRLGKLSAKTKEVIEAAKKANAHGFIKNLPKGYRTIVGERGVKLSGGEQQRINLARAILKNPQIIILDEATSSLDSENEMLVQEALWRFVEGRTTIIIAHRLSTVMRADKIFYIDKGKIEEEGTHEELVEKNGLYARNFRLQTDALFADNLRD